MKKVLSFMLLIALMVPQLGATPKQRPLRKIYLTEANTSVISGSIGNFMVQWTIAILTMKRASLPIDKTLYIVIDSGGGEVGSSLVLRSYIAGMKNTTLICSYCGSAAGMIFVSAKQPRFITEKSSILMHEMYISHMTAAMFTDKEEIERFIKLSDSFDRLFYTMIGISKDEYIAHIRNQVWVLYGQDIKQHHLADKMVELECSEAVKTMETSVCQ